jgi:hypothetical protein
MKTPCRKIHATICADCYSRQSVFTKATVHVTYADGSCNVYCENPLDPWLVFRANGGGRGHGIEVEAISEYELRAQGIHCNTVVLPPDHRWQVLDE